MKDATSRRVSGVTGSLFVEDRAAPPGVEGVGAKISRLPLEKRAA